MTQVAVGAVLTWLGLAACSGDDEEPQTLPDVTPTVTETATPEPTTPEPEETTPEPDPTAALEAEITEFFEEYIDAVNESWTSEDALNRRREMFADSCQECLAGYQFAERAHEEDLILEAEDIVVRDVTLTSSSGRSVTFLTVEDSPPGVLRQGNGDVVQRFDQYIGVQTVYQAIRAGGKWVITQSEDL